MELLSREYEVHSSSSVEGALDLWAGQEIALVIAEALLPDGNGSTLARHGTEHHPDTRFIMMSGDASSAWMVGPAYRNVVDILVKPFGSEAEVLLRVARALSLGGSARPIEAKSRAALDRCLAERSLFYHFQPIVECKTKSIFAYEALCRTSEPFFGGPMELFATAERSGQVGALGRVARKANIDVIRKLPAPCLLFLNLHPMELDSSLLQEAVDELGPMARRVVFEVTESAAIDDLETLKTMMDALRGLGFRFALDDLGAGYAGLNSLAILEPDFVKLDMTLVRAINTSGRASHLVRHILEYAASQGVAAIAEGVETEEEYDQIRGFGCPLVQGYYFARPRPPFPTLPQSIRKKDRIP